MGKGIVVLGICLFTSNVAYGHGAGLNGEQPIHWTTPQIVRTVAYAGAGKWSLWRANSAAMELDDCIVFNTDRAFPWIYLLWHDMPITIYPYGWQVMPTRNIVLTDYQADFIERLVTSGRYQNASEVLREGLRKIEAEEKEARARLRALREAARIGIADVRAERYRTFESPEQISRHLADVTAKVIARKGRTGKAAR